MQYIKVKLRALIQSLISNYRQENYTFIAYNSLLNLKSKPTFSHFSPSPSPLHLEKPQINKSPLHLEKPQINKSQSINQTRVYRKSNETHESRCTVGGVA
jgi:hypothetical protein